MAASGDSVHAEMPSIPDQAPPIHHLAWAAFFGFTPGWSRTYFLSTGEEALHALWMRVFFPCGALTTEIELLVRLSIFSVLSSHHPILSFYIILTIIIVSAIHKIRTNIILYVRHHWFVSSESIYYRICPIFYLQSIIHLSNTSDMKHQNRYPVIM